MGGPRVCSEGWPQLPCFWANILPSSIIFSYRISKQQQIEVHGVKRGRKKRKAGSQCTQEQVPGKYSRNWHSSADRNRGSMQPDPQDCTGYKGRNNVRGSLQAWGMAAPVWKGDGSRSAPLEEGAPPGEGRLTEGHPTPGLHSAYSLPEACIYVFIYIFLGSCDNSSVGMTGLVLH